MNISISQDRVSVELNEKQVAQFVVWDLQPSQHKDLAQQIELSMAISNVLLDVEKHLRINGYDARLEDVYDV